MNKFKIVLLSFGFLILYFLIREISLSAIVEQIQTMGWAFVFLMFFPILFQELLFALALQYSINGRTPGFFKVFCANIAGESVNYITPGTLIGGEPLKAYLLRHHAGVYSSSASIIIAKTTKAVSMIIFVVTSLSISLYHYEFPLLAKSALITVLILLSAGIFIFLYLQKVGFFSNILKWINRIWLPEKIKEKLRRLIQEKGHHLDKLDDQLIKFYKNESNRFYFSILISIVAFIIGAVEIYLFLKFIEVPVSAIAALSIETLSMVINTCFLFMPAGIGTQEAGKVFVCKMLGMLAETGLVIGLLRRIREVVWTFLGLGIFAFYKTSHPVEHKASI